LHHAKEAIIKVIENLAADDVLHLILYATDVSVLFQNAMMSDKDKLIQQVRQIKHTSSTNLWGGVEKGAQVIMEHQKQGFTPRIFLFSDGLVNEGIKDKAKIQQLIADDIYTKNKIKVSAFGLGDDFDEELMKGIAEVGNGAYFFIEGSATIPKFVEGALSGLLRTFGSDAVLKIRGANGGIVKQIYGYDLMAGATFGDLRADNVRAVVCEMEVKPDAKLAEEEILKYELRYLHGEEKAIKVMDGALKIKYTDNENDVVKSRDPVVKIKVVVQKTADIDTELVKLMDSGKRQEAIALQEKQIELFKSVLELDTTGEYHIASELKQAEEALVKLKDESNDREVRKVVHHRGYRKRRDSAEYDAFYM